MPLRLQLLLVSLLVLVLPWAAHRYVQEMEGALRQGQQQALLATGRAVAQALAGQAAFDTQTEPTTEVVSPLYAGLLPHPINLDGYADDWANYAHDYQSVEFGSGVDGSTTLSYRIGIRQERLYLLLEIEDSDKVYYRPVESQANGDRVVLRLLAPDSAFDYYLIASSATGNFNAQRLGGRRLDQIGEPNYRIQGYWLERSEGYRMEIALPLDIAERGLDFFFIDVDSHSRDTFRWQGTADWRTSTKPTPLIHPSRELGEALKPFTPSGLRLRVTDNQGWLLAEQDRRGEATASEQSQQRGLWDAALIQLVRWSLGQEARPSPLRDRSGQLSGGLLNTALGGNSESDWFRQRRTDTPVIVAVAPIQLGTRIAGTVVVEQASDLVAALTELAFTRLFYLTLLVLFIVVVGLLGFASVLSWRVRRLRDAAENAVAADGTIRDDFPRSRSRDELGDLSRSYADLLDELRDYTGYLRRLASILSHELRTPLAVVKSSLENLQQLREGETAGAYLERARDGTERLGRLLSAMSEAGNVEQAVHNEEDEPVDLGALLASCVAGYRTAYPESRFELLLNGIDTDLRINGQPDLLAQLLDKLIDNAVSFSPADQPIQIRLNQESDRVLLSIINYGPLLPASLRNRLFDPMVTVREKRYDAPHLGLGLYIVRLIAERHHATVTAKNLPQAPGVEFLVSFPISK
ncbi:MAG: HAMP domain-containing protein [Proteobacteria bacterium]|nr:MAG: HAMP domain-containing protein [Pseudomonadota bacterium]QKK10747.1 MAG: hypothetical protein HND59_03215 [Pseudomonadota bacterium]